MAYADISKPAPPKKELKRACSVKLDTRNEGKRRRGKKKMKRENIDGSK